MTNGHTPTGEYGILTELKGLGNQTRWQQNPNGDPMKSTKEMIAEPGINLEELIIRSRIPKRLEGVMRYQMLKANSIERLRYEEDNKSVASLPSRFEYRRMPAAMQTGLMTALLSIPSEGASRDEMVSAATMGFGSKLMGGGRKMLGNMFKKNRNEGLNT